MVGAVLALGATGFIDSSLLLGFFCHPSALVLSMYWPHSHLLPSSFSHGGCGGHGDAVAKSPFQEGLAANHGECSELTASSCQLL